MTTKTLARARAADRAWRLTPICLALCLLGTAGLARALPQGGQVVNGQAGIQTGAPGQMDIHQTSNQAIINWQSFSIGSGESVHIAQPNAGSVLLNRVIGNDPSLIFGKLQANGRVFLLNQRGIVFGQGSQVDVGGLLASTLNMGDGDFLAGHYKLTAGDGTPGSLQADGRISAPGGTVALVAPQLSMGGQIEARRVGLAATAQVQVDVEGDGLIFFDMRNDQLDAHLAMTGRVQADGGSVEIRAQARAGFADTVLNLDGVVQARSVGQLQGRIVVDGGTQGSTLVSGALDASGRGAGEHGGEVQVLGAQVGLMNGARIDASGDAGGGRVLVGGDFHGQGPEHNALRTFIAPDVQIHADALGRGNGGQVAVWSDQRTDVYGAISARGGALGGDGGAVETSGKLVLNMPSGSVDVGAPAGHGGTWLLDPRDLLIDDTAGDTGVSASSPFTSTADSAHLSTATLNAALTNGASVAIVTGSTGNQAGDITVNGGIAANLTSGQSASLSLQAQGSIVFGATGSVSAGAGNLNLQLGAGNNAQATNPAISMAPTAAIALGNGSLTATVPGSITLGSVSAGSLNLTSQGNAITQVGNGLVITGASTINAGAGNITLTNAGNDLRGTVRLTGGNTQIASAALQLGALSVSALTASSNGALGLGSGNISGNLVATSGGAVTQSGALNVSGSSTINAGANAITLANTGNQFGATVSLAGGDITLRSSGNLAIGTLTTTLNHGLSLIAGGTLSGLGGAIDTGTGDLTLASLGGSFVLPGSLAGQNVSITSANGLAINQNITARGNLQLASAGNAITQTTGLISTTGATTVNAGSGDITLTNPVNAYGTALALTGGTTTIQSAGALTLGPLAVGALNATTVGALNLGQGTVAGALNVQTNGGAVTQSGALTVTGPTTLATAGGSVTLTNVGNDFQAPINLSVGDAQIAAGNALQLGAWSANNLNLAAVGGIDLGVGTATGTLQASSRGGTIAQTGAISIAGATVLTGDGATTAVALNQSANHFGGGVTLAGANSGGIGSAGVAAADALTIGGTAQSLAARSGTALTLAGGSYGTLDAAAASSITQTAALNVSGVATLTSQGGGAMTIDLSTNGAANELNTVVLAAQPGSTVGVVRITDADTRPDGLRVGGNAGDIGIVSGGNLALTGGSYGTLSADTHTGNANITQTGALTVTGLAQLQSGTGDIVLANTANDFAQVGIASARSATLRDANDLVIAASRVDAGLDVGATGVVSFAGPLSGTGALIANGPGTVLINGTQSYTGGTQVLGGTLVLDGAAAQAGNGGTVTLGSGGRIDLRHGAVLGNALLAQGGTLANSDGAATLNGNITLAGDLPIQVAATGQFVVAGAIVDGGAGHGLTLSGGGTLTLAGIDTYGGATQVLAGTLRAAGAGALPTQSAVSVAAGSTLEIDQAQSIGSLSGAGQVQLQGAPLTVGNDNTSTQFDGVVAGSGGLTKQGNGTFTLTGANTYQGDTVVNGGTLATVGAERLPDAGALHVGANGALVLGGTETVGAIDAAGAVTAAGDVLTAGDQVYTGTLTLTNPTATLLSGHLIDARNAANQFGPGTLSIHADSAQLSAAQNLTLGDVTLANGGQISADRLALDGAVQLNGGHLDLVATAAPDDARATVLGIAQVPGVGRPLAVAEATVTQGGAGTINVANSATLQVTASGGGSVVLANDANRFDGALSVLSGPAYNTAWQPNLRGNVGIQSLVQVAGSHVVVGGAGIEADLIHIRADQLATLGNAVLAARLPFDQFLLGTRLSAPGLTLELAPQAFQQTGSFGQNGQEIRVSVGARSIGNRADGLNAGFIAVLPKNGAQGATAVFLVGPKVSGQVGGYNFFNDGAGQAGSIPVFYNGVLPMTPQATGALSSIDADAEAARQARFQEAVRTENVTVRLRAGVIAEVGPGRPATQGSEGARGPETCEPAGGATLACKKL